MIVVDTNTIAYLYFPNPNNLIVESLQLKDNIWLAPFLWKSEFRNVTASYFRKGYINFEQALTILENAEELMRGNEEDVNSKEVFSLVNKSKCSSYDCEFIALAQQLRLPLITHDKLLLTEFPGIAITAENYLKTIP